MTKNKDNAILSDNFKNRLIKIALNVRKDTEFLFFFMGGGILLLTILVLLWGLPAAVGISTYAQYIETTYPGFPVEQSVVVLFYSVLSGVTRAVIFLIWFFVLLFGVAFAVTDMGYKDKSPSEKQPVSSRPRRNRHSTVDICSHCRSVHTRKAGKDHATGERYCMTCRKFY